MKKIALILGISAIIIAHASNNSNKREIHEVHRNNYELLIGSTTYHHGITRPTFGIDYEKRFRFAHDHFGFGFLIDYEIGNEEVHSELLLTPTLIYFPTHSFKTLGSVGLGIDQHHEFILYRIGVGYEFDINEHFVLAPSMYFDTGKNYNALVLGMSFGLGY